MAQIVPITSDPNQSIRASLIVNGDALILNLTIYWNAYGQFWQMNVADQTGNDLVLGVPLLSGVWPAANVLAPYEYLVIGAAYLINLDGAATDLPDDSNLGTAWALLWDDNPEPVAA